ncbi:hypothetical protein BEN47_09940 [Hymenobacter lapidarius]|uniref:Uncharacterized protein n=1 Tax=Hymenobacter lapidarius TaxID=1908237 RepID=A0A1G1TB07_9BACT|nr:hypothetical protein BEN47_09940 [Hymenobacter lapidarius]
MALVGFGRAPHQQRCRYFITQQFLEVLTGRFDTRKEDGYPLILASQVSAQQGNERSFTSPRQPDEMVQATQVQCISIYEAARFASLQADNILKPTQPALARPGSCGGRVQLIEDASGSLQSSYCYAQVLSGLAHQVVLRRGGKGQAWQSQTDWWRLGPRAGASY